MADPTARNRLDEEESPYLAAHADNPVNWQPWDDAALDAARERDLPIFLSVGYSSCHWCHVMAEESFSDPAIAERLNENFVPIKVDREERPDVDSVYMTVCRLVTRGGCGWPLSVWLTPEARPFYVGTYFPAEERHGRPAFGDLLDEITESWERNRSELEDRADQWMAAARDELEDVPLPASDPPGSDLLASAAGEAVERADRRHGGFGRGQKFPQTGRLHALARTAARTEDSEAAYRDVLTDTLDAMAAGGLRDQLGGGFHRYTVDRDWTVPHFEKMLYDNAEIARAFIVGHRLTGDEGYAAVARETFAFVDRELRHPGGGFYSTLDARSQPPGDDGGDDRGAGDVGDSRAEEAGDSGAMEAGDRGAEGVYYTWTPDAVETAMAEHADAAESDAPASLLADVFTERYGVTADGDVEGRAVLTQASSLSAVADAVGRSEEAVSSLLPIAEERARAARAERPRPPRDEKVLAGWNGLMIHALAEGALTLDPGYATAGAEALSFVRDRLWDGTRLAHRYKDGDVLGEGYLADYAFLARGALALHGATGELDHLAFALDLGRAMVDRFWDPDQGTLYFTDGADTGLPVRPQEVGDQSTPASTGVAVQVLSALDAIDPDAGFADVAERVLKTHAAEIRESPGGHGTLALAADDHALGQVEVTVAAETIPQEWRRAVGSRIVPARLLTRRPPTETGLADWLDALDLDDAPPIWAGREAREGPTAFVCRGACSPPIQETSDLRRWLEEMTPRAPDRH